MSDPNRDVTSTIEALLSERREFPPPGEFARGAVVSSPSIYEEGERFEDFWARQSEQFVWRRPHRQVLDWSNPPFARWFVDAKLNITENCLDRHLESAGDKVAYYWEGEPGDGQAQRNGVQPLIGRSPVDGCQEGGARGPVVVGEP